MVNGVMGKSVLFLSKKKPRMPQKYRIKYHEGTVNYGESRDRH
jgi:hypothetical protein